MVAAAASVIIGLIAATGYAGIAALMAVESACLPVPSELVMPFAGYLASQGRLDLWLAATAGAVGCNLGSAAAYAIGRHGGRRWIGRYGRYVLLTEADVDRSERFFGRFGGPAVLIGRLMPGLRSFIALPAGIAGMPVVRFHAYTFAGSWAWCFGLAWAGRALGARWRDDPRLAGLLHRADLALALVAVGALLAFAVRRVRRSG